MISTTSPKPRLLILPLLGLTLALGSLGVQAKDLSPITAGWTQTKGGAGGAILRVTTLAAQGSGSLGEALARKGPRIIVFEVGGVIDLGGKSYQIKEPFVTIAGQTAPAPGITLIKGGIGIGSHDVIIQHLMVRPGEAGQAKKSGWEVDGIASSSGAYDVIVDHCSLTWATDENLSASGARFSGGNEDPAAWRAGTAHRVTFSNNLIAEGLSNSTHSKGEHSKGSLIHDNAADIAIVGNLYASNMERNPLFKGGTRGVVVNNLISNPGRVIVHYGLLAGEWGKHAFQLGQIAIVGNVAIYGPDTAKLKTVPAFFTLRGQGPCEVYLEDNQGEGAAASIAPTSTVNPELLTVLPQRPFWPPSLKAMPAGEVAIHLVTNVGARPWNRDPIDQRIITEALAGTTRIIDSEAAVGGYPKYEETHARFETADWDLATMSRKQTP